MSEAEVKKSRGRPPKAESEKKAEVAPVVEETGSGDAPAKRGRGRPKGTFKKNKKVNPWKKPYDGPPRGRGRPKTDKKSA